MFSHSKIANDFHELMKKFFKFKEKSKVKTVAVQNRFMAKLK
jgi:hypothetical protein